jgi:uncharacterized membrane protein (DUF106 family)
MTTAKSASAKSRPAMTSARAASCALFFRAFAVVAVIAVAVIPASVTAFAAFPIVSHSKHSDFLGWLMMYRKIYLCRYNARYIFQKVMSLI